MTYYKNLNSCVKGVEILASAISVPITNLNNIIIVNKNFAFALTNYCGSNKSIALLNMLDFKSKSPNVLLFRTLSMRLTVMNS